MNTNYFDVLKLEGNYSHLYQELCRAVREIDFRHRKKEDNELLMYALTAQLEDYGYVHRSLCRSAAKHRRQDNSARADCFSLHVYGEIINKPNIEIPLGPRDVASRILRPSGPVSLFLRERFNLTYHMLHLFNCCTYGDSDRASSIVPLFRKFFRFGRYPKDIFLKKFQLPADFDMNLLNTEFPYRLPGGIDILGETILNYRSAKAKVPDTLPRNDFPYGKIYELLAPAYLGICIPIGQKRTVKSLCKNFGLLTPYLSPSQIAAVPDEIWRSYTAHLKFRALSPLEYCQKYGDTDIYGDTIIRFNVHRFHKPGTYDDRTPKRRTDEERI